MGDLDDGPYNNNNRSLFDDEFKREVYRTVVPIMVVWACICMMVNMYIVLATCYIRRGFTCTLKLTLSLALADTWASILLACSFVLNSYAYVKSYNIPHVGCVFLGIEAVKNGGLITSVYHLLVLAINHYLNIAYPFTYSKVLTPFRTLFTILSLWLIPPAGFFVLFSLFPNQGFLSEYCDIRLNYSFYNSLAFRLSIFMLILLPFFVMSIVYGSIFARLAQLKDSLNQSGSASANAVFRRQQLRKKRSTLITALCILFTFVIGWLPTTIIFLFMCDRCPLSKAEIKVQVGLGIFSMCLLLVKTLVNPIIYALRIPEIEEALQRMRRQTSRWRESMSMSWKSGSGPRGSLLGSTRPSMNGNLEHSMVL